MQPQQLDNLIRQAMHTVEAIKTEVGAVLLSSEFRDQLRAIVRDELTDELRDQGKNPDALAFELRFLRRELEALTKQLANTQEDEQ